MIPLRDVIPSRTVPGVTLALITAFAAVLLGQIWVGDRAEPVSAGFASGPLPSLIASLFLHAGLLQAAVSMLFLWLFGENVEDRFGHVRFAIVYALCGITAVVAGAVARQDAPLPAAAASGAVSGIIGAYMALFPRSRIVTVVPLAVVTHVVELPVVFFLAVWLLLQTITGTMAGEAAVLPLWTHAAALAAGAGSAPLFSRTERLRVEWWDDR